MGKRQDLLDSISGTLSLSRRSFVKSAMAISSASALYGCSKEDAESIIYGGGGSVSEGLTPPAITEERLPVSSGHNCGGRCPSVALVRNGQIQRIISDEHPDGDIAVGVGSPLRSCSRCRAYKGRLNSLGRIKYPMKQTLDRGNMAGFIRISWDQAAKEIAKEIWDTMKDPFGGPQAIWPNIATANSGQIAGRSAFDAFLNGYCGGTTNRKYNYSSAQRGYIQQFTSIGSSAFSLKYSSMVYSKYMVLWGTHNVTTYNQSAYPTIQASEAVRRNGGKIYYIGPKVMDTCAVLADEWIPIKPGTDSALAIAIMYDMVENQANKADRIKFIKKASYGFFPSVGYWINAAGDKKAVISGAVQNVADEYDMNTASGDDGSINPATIDGSLGAVALWRYIKQVPTGHSFYDYLKGTYNYVPYKDSAKYPYKKYINVEKTPAWAEKITGISEGKIKELATVYTGDDPVFSNRSNGEQRAYGGVYQDFATDILVMISGQWGRPGAGLHHKSSVSSVPKTGSGPTYKNFCSNDKNFKSPAYHAASIWHAIARLPGFDENGKVFANDGDVAARYVIERKADWKPFSDNDPFERYSDAARTIADSTGSYFKVKLDNNGKPVKTSGRVIFNCGGGMLGNQHMNTFLNDIWLRDRSIWKTIVVFESHMSSTARYGDYILPEATNMEREDIFSGEGCIIATSEAQKAPGESIIEYEFAVMLARELGKLDGVGSTYVDTFSKGKTYRQWLRDAWESSAARNTKDINGKTYSYEEFRKEGAIYFGEVDLATPPLAELRKNLEDNSVKISPLAPEAENRSRISGFTQPLDPTPITGKFPVCCWDIPVEYVNRGKVVWGSLPEVLGGSLAGIEDKDEEGDKFVLPIPVYIPMDEYKAVSNILDNPTAYGSDVSKAPLHVLCTHDKYRSHSTHNENIYLRELYKYSEVNFDEKGNRKLADDADTYCVLQNPKSDKNFGEVAPIGGDGLPVFWINKKDAEARNIKNMDVIRVFNGVGALKAVAEISNRIIPGVTWLSQGAWTDLRIINGKKVDVGGNVNSITSEWPSKVDNNNAQMTVFAYVEKWS